MANSCCQKSRTDYQALSSNQPRNVRYQYVDIAPLTKGLKVDLTTLNTNHDVVFYDYDVTLKIQKRGCREACASSLKYKACIIEDNTLYFIFDPEFLKLCRGRYEGIISMGCDEVPCRLDFKIGQQLCITNVLNTTYLDCNDCIFDATNLPNPNCCDKCHEVTPCGCFDATQQRSMCGTSINGCEDNSINLKLETAKCQLDALDAWIAEQQAT